MVGAEAPSNEERGQIDHFLLIKKIQHPEATKMHYFDVKFKNFLGKGHTFHTLCSSARGQVSWGSKTSAPGNNCLPYAPT